MFREQIGHNHDHRSSFNRQATQLIETIEEEDEEKEGNLRLTLNPELNSPKSGSTFKTESFSDEDL